MFDDAVTPPITPNDPVTTAVNVASYPGNPVYVDPVAYVYAGNGPVVTVSTNSIGSTCVDVDGDFVYTNELEPTVGLTVCCIKV
jgi:type II secretory pathway component HofQ